MASGEFNPIALGTNAAINGGLGMVLGYATGGTTLAGGALFGLINGVSYHFVDHYFSHQDKETVEKIALFAVKILLTSFIAWGACSLMGFSITYSCATLLAFPLQMIANYLQMEPPVPNVD